MPNMKHETIFGLTLIGLGMGIIFGVATTRADYFADPSVKYAYPQTLQIYGTGEIPSSPVSQSVVSDRRAIEAYVCSDKFNWDCAKVKRIIFCESSYREKVVSRTGDVGVLQIAPVHGYGVSYLSDYRNNIDAGYKLFLARGYQPWVSSIKCQRRG